MDACYKRHKGRQSIRGERHTSSMFMRFSEAPSPHFRRDAWVEHRAYRVYTFD